jgi:Na+-translocating ferredoxin:NAD+ oxidoreductase RnfE subunit
MARTYWDAFGVGMMMAVFLIVLGSLWSVYSGYRASRGKAAEE